MSTQPTPRPKLSAAERLATIQTQVNQPIQCEKCGSMWFTDVSFQQYSGSRYSTTPGGDIQVISALNHRVRVCLCGEPVAPNIGGVRPGRTAAAEVNSFMASFKVATTWGPQPTEARSRWIFPCATTDFKNEEQLCLNTVV